MVAIDQSRDDLSAERERGSVARWPLAMKLPSPLLFDCRHCYFYACFWCGTTRRAGK
jgi:hypothetical protein